ncbi:unnamed protein product, partial [Scytosiphon promiscuus]
MWCCRQPKDAQWAKLLFLGNISHAKIATSMIPCNRGTLSRVQSEVLIRVRPKHVQHRFLRSVPCGEFLAWSPGKWGIGEATATRCRKTFSVLASSNRAGPEVVEIDNCVATRFNIRDGYPHSLELLRAFVEEKHGLIRDGNRIDRRSDFVVSGFHTGDDFDGMSVRSSHKHTAGGTVRARPRTHTRENYRMWEKRPLTKRAASPISSRKRTAPFPRRPKPAEKPRLAPPHSTRTIRASATCTCAIRFSIRSRSVLALDSVLRWMEAASSSSSYCGRRMTLPTFPVATKPGKAVGCRNSRSKESGRLIRDEHQCRQKVDGDGDHFGSIEGGSGGRESRCRFTKEHDPSIPTSRSIARGFRSERGMQRGGDPRRSDPPTKPLIRVPGHERRRPYSTFHRFKKMEQETRKVFFSLSCNGTDTGDSHGFRGTANISSAEVGDGAGAGDDENNKTRFSANFGRKEAWTSTPEPTLRTQGPYLGKNGCTSQGAQVEACRSWINPKRWAFSGVKV